MSKHNVEYATLVTALPELPESQFTTLRDQYEIRDETRVSSCLRRYPFLPSLMLEAAERGR